MKLMLKVNPFKGTIPHVFGKKKCLAYICIFIRTEQTEEEINKTMVSKNRLGITQRGAAVYRMRIASLIRIVLHTLQAST